MSLFNFLFLVDKSTNIIIASDGETLVDSVPLYRLPYVKVVPYINSIVTSVSVVFGESHSLRINIMPTNTRRATA